MKDLIKVMIVSSLLFACGSVVFNGIVKPSVELNKQIRLHGVR